MKYIIRIIVLFGSLHHKTSKFLFCFREMFFFFVHPFPRNLIKQNYLRVLPVIRNAKYQGRLWLVRQWHHIMTCEHRTKQSALFVKQVLFLETGQFIVSFLFLEFSIIEFPQINIFKTFALEWCSLEIYATSIEV